eukprot:m.70379 g.70379  ORF g.70379 m.70379 type:complete len:385 (+) comp14061_c0_seq5:65-1219(+)
MTGHHYYGLLAVAMTILQGSWAAPAQTQTGKLLVFVLAGQSNMEGQAEVNTTNTTSGLPKNGTLLYQLHDPRTAAEFAETWDAQTNNWTVLPNIKVWFNEAGAQGGVNGSVIPGVPGVDASYGSLTVGYGVRGNRNNIGPEYGFGFGMRDMLPLNDTTKILIIKTAWGGKTLQFDFRPPRSAALPDQYCVTPQCSQVGHYYKVMLDDVAKIMAPGVIPKMFPDLAGFKPEIHGFGWFQGWNDGCDLNETASYEYNLVNLIKDLREEWKTPSLAVSVPVSGFDGFTNEEATRRPPGCWWDGNKLGCSCSSDRGCRRLDIVLSQFAGTNSTLHPDLNGHAIAMETRGFWRDPEFSPNAAQGYHFFHNAETYFLIGKAMAKGMIAMM